MEPKPAIAQEFQELAAQWKRETAGLSSPTAARSHPAYLRIIELGRPALHLIFQDLKVNGGWSYPALRQITGANPVPEQARGNRDLNDAAWLQWAEEHGYI